MSEEMCIYQGIFGIAYFIGAMCVVLKIWKNLNIDQYAVILSGLSIVGLGIYLWKIDLYNHEQTEVLYSINAIDFFLGITNAIMEANVLQKVVTNTNRPQFFTGLCYFLSSISSILVFYMPSYLFI